MMTNSNPQQPKYMDHSSTIQMDHWDSKLQILADTLMHHVKDEGERDGATSKGVYIDFRRLKLPA